MAEESLTQARLMELVEYDPATGVFINKINRGVCLKNKGIESGFISNAGYRRMCIDYKTYFAHRLAFLYMDGLLPVEEVDHKNGNKLDNRWDNLRRSTRKENSKNLPRYYGSREIIAGVCFDKHYSKWAAYIEIDKKKTTLGRFSNLFDACAARISAESKAGIPSNRRERRCKQ